MNIMAGSQLEGVPSEKTFAISSYSFDNDSEVSACLICKFCSSTS